MDLNFREKLSEAERLGRYLYLNDRSIYDWKETTIFLKNYLLSIAYDGDAVSYVRCGLMKRRMITVSVNDPRLYYHEVTHSEIKMFCNEECLKLYYMLEDGKISKKYIPDKVVYFLISI